MRPRILASASLLFVGVVVAGCRADDASDVEALARFLVTALKPGAHHVVADIGAGSGAVAHAFARALPSGAVIATELRQAELDRIAAAARQADEHNLSVRRATMESSGLGDAEVDLAILCRVDHLLHDRRAYLVSLSSAIKPGGRVVIVNDVREEPAVLAIGAALRWQLIERFEPMPRMFALSYHLPVGASRHP